MLNSENGGRVYILELEKNLVRIGMMGGHESHLDVIASKVFDPVQQWESVVHEFYEKTEHTLWHQFHPHIKKDKKFGEVFDISFNIAVYFAKIVIKNYK